MKTLFQIFVLEEDSEMCTMDRQKNLIFYDDICWEKIDPKLGFWQKIKLADLAAHHFVYFGRLQLKNFIP